MSHMFTKTRLVAVTFAALFALLAMPTWSFADGDDNSCISIFKWWITDGNQCNGGTNGNGGSDALVRVAGPVLATRRSNVTCRATTSSISATLVRRRMSSHVRESFASQ